MSASTQLERILVRSMTKTKRKRKKKIQTRNRKLVEKYPWLIPRNDWTGKIIDGYDYTWTELDGWPKGWVKAFGRVFADELGAALEEAGLSKTYRVFQSKEKYGQCRWYDNGGTQKTHNIIRAFEYISERICYSCGKLDVPMINDGWYCPTCLECFKKNYRRREKWKMEHNPDYEPVSDEYLETLYAECIADEPDENGQYLIPMSYKVKTGYKETEKIIEYDISDIVNKIRKRS